MLYPSASSIVYFSLSLCIVQKKIGILINYIADKVNVLASHRFMVFVGVYVVKIESNGRFYRTDAQRCLQMD